MYVCTRIKLIISFRGCVDLPVSKGVGQRGLRGLLEDQEDPGGPGPDLSRGGHSDPVRGQRRPPPAEGGRTDGDGLVEEHLHPGQHPPLPPSPGGRRPLLQTRRPSAARVSM